MIKNLKKILKRKLLLNKLKNYSYNNYTIKKHLIDNNNSNYQCFGNGNNNNDDDDYFLMLLATYLSYYHQK